MGGTKWEMNTPGLACCHHGPPGCKCLDTYYISNSTTARCLGVSASGDEGTVRYMDCDLTAFSPSLMWHEVTYQAEYNEIDSLGWAFGGSAGEDNCMGVTGCHAGATLFMETCGKGDQIATRFRFEGAPGRPSIGVLRSDSCPGFCALADPSTGSVTLGDCSDDKSTVERRCVMAPGQAPVACPATGPSVAFTTAFI